MSFFILVAMLWVLLWTYVPDHTPDQFSGIDALRVLFLLFSFMAFGFAVLMLLIRYKGVDLISRYIPHAGLVLWVGKHAYQYSQPKTILYCVSGHDLSHRQLLIQANNRKHSILLNPTEIQIVDLGYLNEEPELQWQNNSEQSVTKHLPIQDRLKKFGKNIHVDVTISNDQINFKYR